jgi:hypothetical protein
MPRTTPLQSVIHTVGGIIQLPLPGVDMRRHLGASALVHTPNIEAIVWAVQNDTMYASYACTGACVQASCAGQGYNSVADAMVTTGNNAAAVTISMIGGYSDFEDGSFKARLVIHTDDRRLSSWANN